MIDIKDLQKEYGNNTVLSSIDLNIPAHTVTSIIGPSGSGKTTLLRLMALLERPTSGSIVFDGVDTHASEKVRLEMRRRMVIVFQKPIVFNGSVYDNVVYGLKIRRKEKHVMASLALDALDAVDLSGYEKRNARSLSGGEVQRVALARAMVTEPELLMLDEPTANLDPLSATRVERLITRVTRESHTTVIMTTHNMTQGQRLADQIGVLIGGEMLQIGSPSNVFNLPNSKEVADFVGVQNVLEGKIGSKKDGLVNISIGNHMLEGISILEPGVDVLACIRPEEVTLALTQPSSSARNAFYGIVTGMATSGPLVLVTVDCSFPLMAFITNRSAEEMELRVGLEVCASFKASGLHILES